MVVIWVCICASILTVSSSAPISEDEEHDIGYTNTDSRSVDYLRGKRLNNNVYTITPCAAAAAAAAAANMAVARSPEMEYPTFIPPEARYYVPSAYDYANSGYAANMFRLEDPYRNSGELLRYSDGSFMEPLPTARFAYRTAPSSYIALNTPNAGNLNVQAGSSGPAYGVFSGGNYGNCNVPLLFSCSPSVVTGQMVKPETQVYGSPTSYAVGAAASSGGYRGSDGHYAQRNLANQEQTVYENSDPVNKAIAAHSDHKST